MTAQILAAVIFVGMFALIIMDKFERQYVTLGSAALVLVVVFGICMHSWDAIKNALNLGAIFRADFWYGASESASSGVNWSTIFFITGMMIMVEGLGKSGFFRWLCLSLATLAHYHVVPLLLCFMAMSAFLAMFIDSITVVLFLATVTLELAQILCFDPVPMILSEVFCANLGGAATMCGDPPNIIIGTARGYTFTDFIKNTGVIIGICFVFVLIFFWLCFRKPLKASEATRPADAVCPAPATAIANRKAFVADVIVFLIAVALLVTHAQTGLTVSCIGVIVACLTLLVTVFTNGGAAVKEVLRGVDYKTLLFFIGLFISVAGLEQPGVLQLLAQLQHQRRQHQGRHPHHPAAVGRVQRTDRQHSVRSHHGPGRAVHCGDAGHGSVRARLGAVARHRPRRQRHAHRRVGQRRVHVRVGQEWSPHQLLQILLILRPGHRAGHCGLAGMPVPEIPVILHQKGGNAS